MFPCEIWERIFSLLKTADTSTLLAGRETCRDFKYWVDTKTSLWSRMSLYRAVQDKENLEICRLIIENVANKNPNFVHGFTPLHCAAGKGHLEICRLIIEYLEDKNPKYVFGETTPLHQAAEEGHLEICRLIIENVDDKNPKDDNGLTPLYCAAEGGHLEICRLIIGNVEDKNPKKRQWMDSTALCCTRRTFGDLPSHH